MGGAPWFYFVDYDPDVNAALQKLRQREFQAGRYNPAVRFPEFPVGPHSPAPGAKHRSIEEALKASDADGTRSILDMEKVSTRSGYGVVAPLPEEHLVRLFGTTKPTHGAVEDCYQLFDILERGQGVYIVVYQDDQPAEYFFAGYSYD